MIVPLCDSTYIYLASRRLHHVPHGAPGGGGEEKKRRGPRKALIRRGASRVEGSVRRRDRGSYMAKKGSRARPLSSLFHSSVSPPPPVILNVVLLSHAALMAVCHRVCIACYFVYECVHARPAILPCVQFPLNTISIHY